MNKPIETEDTLPVPFTYFDQNGQIQLVCFFIPVPKEEGVSTHGVDIRKILNSSAMCYTMTNRKSQ